MTELGHGIHTDLKGPHWGHGKCTGWPAFKCRCQMTPPVCDPIDSYHSVFQCDNSESTQHEATCKYTKVRN